MTRDGACGGLREGEKGEREGGRENAEEREELDEEEGERESEAEEKCTDLDEREDGAGEEIMAEEGERAGRRRGG